MIALTAHLTVLPEKKEELLQTLQSLLCEIEQQQGCVECLVGRNEDVALLFSIWEDRASLEKHLRSEQIGVLLGASGLLAAPPRFRFSDPEMPEASEAIERARREVAGTGAA
jgi:quinol monooxygenase YgiN